MLEGSMTLLFTTDNIFFSGIFCNYGKGKIKFKGICLKQDKVFLIHGNEVNVYVTYELDTWSRDLNTDFTLGNCLSMKLT